MSNLQPYIERIRAITDPLVESNLLVSAASPITSKWLREEKAAVTKAILTVMADMLEEMLQPNPLKNKCPLGTNCDGTTCKYNHLEMSQEGQMIIRTKIATLRKEIQK